MLSFSPLVHPSLESLGHSLVTLRCISSACLTPLNASLISDSVSFTCKVKKDSHTTCCVLEFLSCNTFYTGCALTGFDNASLVCKRKPFPTTRTAPYSFSTTHLFLILSSIYGSFFTSSRKGFKTPNIICLVMMEESVVWNAILTTPSGKNKIQEKLDDK